jgi:hypothetical protein
MGLCLSPLPCIFAKGYAMKNAALVFFVISLFMIGGSASSFAVDEKQEVGTVPALRARFGEIAEGKNYAPLYFYFQQRPSVVEVAFERVRPKKVIETAYHSKNHGSFIFYTWDSVSVEKPIVLSVRTKSQNGTEHAYRVEYTQNTSSFKVTELPVDESTDMWHEEWFVALNVENLAEANRELIERTKGISVQHDPRLQKAAEAVGKRFLFRPTSEAIWAATQNNSPLSDWTKGRPVAVGAISEGASAEAIEDEAKILAGRYGFDSRSFGITHLGNGKLLIIVQ